MSEHKGPRGFDSEVVYEAYLKHGRDKVAAAKALGTTEATVRRHVAKFESTEVNENKKEQEIIGLRKQVRQLERRVLDDARVQTEIMGLSQAPHFAPDWLERVPATAGKKHFAGTPVFFASDWHWGEVVRPAEIGGINEYNPRIAVERAETFVNIGIELLKDHMTKARYDGCVLALGGDMVSGDIHDELMATNEIESMPAILQMNGVLSEMIERLAAEFGKVFVPCVTGNHGRMHRKPRAKRRNHTNFDWLLYNLLAMHFKNDKRITFQIPEGPDAYFRVYNTRYLLTHGDQFRGGDGMIGPIGPIFRGDKKKRARNVETDHSYDVIMMGHFHQYIHLQQLIVNGSLKGYDEYAYTNNFGFEPAQQALWVTHPEHGITFRMPVYCQRLEKDAAAPWVSVKG